MFWPPKETCTGTLHACNIAVLVVVVVVVLSMSHKRCCWCSSSHSIPWPYTSMFKIVLLTIKRTPSCKLVTTVRHGTALKKGRAVPARPTLPQAIHPDCCRKPAKHKKDRTACQNNAWPRKTSQPADQGQHRQQQTVGPSTNTKQGP
ncbi:unnamed protein product, partial [Ectocarpus sp. 8 AP-2014]